MNAETASHKGRALPRTARGQMVSKSLPELQMLNGQKRHVSTGLWTGLTMYLNPTGLLSLWWERSKSVVRAMLSLAEIANYSSGSKASFASDLVGREFLNTLSRETNRATLHAHCYGTSHNSDVIIYFKNLKQRML
jgi:hypothetical protein